MFIGAALGTTGGGGSLLAIPLLVYVLNMRAQPAAATSLVVVAISALLGVYQRRTSGEVKGRAALILSLTGAVGAWAGAYSHRYVREEIVLLAFGLVMMVAAVQMWRRSSDPSQDSSDTNCADRFPPSCWRRLSMIGAVVGLLTGFFGVGGGFVIVPALVLVLGFPMQVAVSTSLLIIALMAVGGIIGHLQTGHMDWQVTGLLLTGSAVGMTVGSRVAPSLSPIAVARSFALLAAGVAGIMMIHNSVKLFGG